MKDLAYALGLMGSAAINAINGHLSRKQNEKLERSRQEFSREQSENQQNFQLQLEETRQVFQRYHELRRETFAREQFASQKEFQRELEGRREEVTLKLEDRREAFGREQFERQAMLQFAIESDRNLFAETLETRREDFWREKFEIERQAQLQMSDKHYQEQLALAERNHQLRLKEAEAQHQIKMWPLKNMPLYYLKDANADASGVKLRREELTILLSPPVLNHDERVSSPKFPKCEHQLSQAIRKFIHEYQQISAQAGYPIAIKLRDGDWKSKSYYGGSVIEQIHRMMSSDATMILESHVEDVGDYLTTHLAYWNYGDPDYIYQPVLEKLEFMNFIHEAALESAREWKTKRKAYLDQGVDAKKLQILGGRDEANQGVLDLIDQVSAGTDKREIQRIYRCLEHSSEHWEQLLRFLEVSHCLVAGCLLDVHYYTSAGRKPIMPRLVKNLLGQFQHPKILESIIEGYRGIYQLVAIERPLWIPELSLDMAEAFLSLEDSNWSIAQVKESISFWLWMRGKALPNNLDDSVALIIQEMLEEDKPYVQRLKDCLSELNFVEQSACLAECLTKKFYPVFTFETVRVNDQGNIVERKAGRAEYIQLDLGNGVSLELVKIPGGSFMMGSPESEAERYSNESPQHRVTVSDFWMGKYPITQGQWEAVMGNNPSHFKGKDRPVEQVFWHDAQNFCQKLSQKTGQSIQLPSEAEWEYACRGGTTSPFYFGATITPDIANYAGNDTYGNAPKGIYRQETTIVGNFPPNAYGLYDLHGNVWEWCLDHWHDNYNGAPTDGSAWVTGGDSEGRILRGGSWCICPRLCRSASRLRFTAGYLYYFFGFRVVCPAARGS